MSLRASSSFLAGSFFSALDDDPFVHRGVDDLDLGDAEFGDLLDDRLGQRLEGARDDEALFRVDRILDRAPCVQIVLASRLPSTLRSSIS